MLTPARRATSSRDAAAPSRANTPQQAAEQGDIVVVAIPLTAYAQVPAGPLRGKVVVDTANYKPAEHPGHLPAVDAGLTTPHELMQFQLPDAHVVKAFSNIFFRHLATLGRPAGAPDRSALPIAGDDTEAKATVAALIDTLGYDTVDAGDLRESRLFAVFGTPANGAHLDPVGGFAAPGRPASVAAVAELLEQSRP
ncbi:NAD(P)-binding domain-containing protein [Kineosporia sp. NBRC 101731]|uniref:NADPH-dependent F420 reductase n=1 Tax=Kineosporia sp. NBRC 101731 TaxID=3032199 RepID=UPI0024A32BEE|nr:NAD(P)-binding domain-containing protein [Kineosporia sp. NBRC 101731]GLY29059.1 NADP oxidoreductase [Kineosporia sp. NBRC 101731]